MRYGIFSDVHSNLEALEAVIAAYKKESIDRYLCVGDVVGYGPDPGECVEKVRQLAAVTVAGNHDWACVDLLPVSYFNPAAAAALLWTRKHLDSNAAYFLQSLKLVHRDSGITLVHSTLDEPQEFNYLLGSDAADATFRLLDTGVCFVGHTHIPGIFKKDKSGNITSLKGAAAALEEGSCYIANTGSVGQPRDGIPGAVFCIYDSEVKTIILKRVHYDIEKTRKKIIGVGLPQSLGDRLLAGR
ncbi:MAG: metallophosphoesterase family protein [Candidatus Omnitrophota bacterium]